jgi:cation:H+ antiporter
LGLVGLICPLGLSDKNIRPHVWLHWLLACALFFVISREYLDLIAVLPLLTIIIMYLYTLFKDMKSEKLHENEEIKDSNVRLFLGLIIGFSLLFIGGKYLVDSVIDICNFFQVDEYIVSAIIIALGTSFPELVTALVAARKKKDSDLIVGNIIGSNLFNCAFILSTLGFYNFKMNGNLLTEIIVLSLGSSLLLILMLLRSKISKSVGTVFLALYGYMVYVWMGNF